MCLQGYILEKRKRYIYEEIIIKSSNQLDKQNKDNLKDKYSPSNLFDQLEIIKTIINIYI